ncbi:MAG TPA: hypothetical protein VJX91_04235 [Candidatus Eisenbacteria bacterium]|nr:hypothetical protein [Candidatus Eisenbacteria bacterium]
MKRIFMMAALLALLVPAVLPTKSEAAVSVGVSFHVGDPYGGLSLHFSSAPRLALIPASQVYYVPNYDRDLYRYGNTWYTTQDDCWYQSSSYNGPFVQIAVSSVPRPIWNIPNRYRRGWGGSQAAYRGYQGRGYDQGWNQGSTSDWNGYQGRNGYQDRNGYQGQNEWQRNDRNDDQRNDRWTDNGQRDRRGGRQRHDRRNVQDGRYGSR